MGYIYIAWDKSKPEYCKVGMTKRLDVNQRISQTENPDYVLYKSYYVDVPNIKTIESTIHQILSQKYSRRKHQSTNRLSEWFECSPSKAVEVISDYFIENKYSFQSELLEFTSLIEEFTKYFIDTQAGKITAKQQGAYLYLKLFSFLESKSNALLWFNSIYEFLIKRCRCHMLNRKLAIKHRLTYGRIIIEIREFRTNQKISLDKIRSLSEQHLLEVDFLLAISNYFGFGTEVNKSLSEIYLNKIFNNDELWHSDAIFLLIGMNTLLPIKIGKVNQKYSDFDTLMNKS